MSWIIWTSNAVLVGLACLFGMMKKSKGTARKPSANEVEQGVSPANVGEE